MVGHNQGSAEGLGPPEKKGVMLESAREGDRTSIGTSFSMFSGSQASGHH